LTCKAEGVKVSVFFFFKKGVVMNHSEKPTQDTGDHASSPDDQSLPVITAESAMRAVHLAHQIKLEKELKEQRGNRIYHPDGGSPEDAVVPAPVREIPASIANDALDCACTVRAEEERRRAKEVPVYTSRFLRRRPYDD
jgi:hypothetical protein